MRLFYRDKGPDPRELNNFAKTEVGKNGKRYGDILGFWGTFSFVLEDVWISDKIEKALEGRLKFMRELVDIIGRFIKGDYGLYSSRTRINDYNVEDRFLGLDMMELGLYETSLGRVYLYMNREQKKTMFWFQDEPEAEQILLKNYGDVIYETSESETDERTNDSSTT